VNWAPYPGGQRDILLTLGFKTIPTYNYFELLAFAAELAKANTPNAERSTQNNGMGCFLCKSLFCFSHIMDANFYVGILEQRLPEIREADGAFNRIMILSIPRVLQRNFSKQCSNGFGLALQQQS